MNQEQQSREEMVRLGRMLHQKNLVAATDGNLTVRLEDNRILATPTGTCKGMLEPEDLVVVDMERKAVSGKRRVSSEIGMHLLIYRLRPEVNGIVHAHPATATAHAAAGLPLDEPLVSELLLSLGTIPLARYATPGTSDLLDTLAPLVPHHDAILMANHGVVTYGSSLLQAYMKMETVEHYAKIALITHLLGKRQLIGPDEVRKLTAQRIRDLL